MVEDYRPWGDQPDKAAFDAAYREPDGTPKWPANDGAAGPVREVTLPAGTVLDRFGYPGGEYLSPLDPGGHPYSYADRSILPEKLGQGYHLYVLNDPVTVGIADVAPAFGQDGGGRQIKLVGTDLQTLLADGAVREVSAPPPDGLVLPHDYGLTRPDGSVPQPTTVEETRNAAPPSAPHAGAGHAAAGHAGTEHPVAGHAASEHALQADPAQSGGDKGEESHQAPHDDHHSHDIAQIPVPEGLPEHLHDVFRAGEDTPAGRSYFSGDDPALRELARRVEPDPHHYTVDVHGNEDGARIGDRALSPRDVADLVRSDPNWDGRPVRLISCDSGAHPDGFAGRLARELGVPVVAPDRTAWTDQHGRVFASGGTEGPNGLRPTWPPDGAWRTHHPDGRVELAGEHGFPAGSEVLPGRSPDDAGARGDGTRPDPHADPEGARRYDALDKSKYYYRPSDGTAVRRTYRDADGNHRLHTDEEGREYPQVQWNAHDGTWEPRPHEPVIPSQFTDQKHHGPASPEHRQERRRLVEERDEAIKRVQQAKADYAAHPTEEHRQERSEAFRLQTDAGEALGESAADHAIPAEYGPPRYVSAEKLDLHYPDDGGSRRFDQLWKVIDANGHERYVIVEAKGPSATLGSARSAFDDRRYQQGHPVYVENIIGQMRDRGGAESALARRLQIAMDTGDLEYVMVQARVAPGFDSVTGEPLDPASSEYDGYTFGRFDLGI